MRARLLAAAVVAAALSTTSVSATVLIDRDNGGPVEEYIARFLQVRGSGELVVIDGECLSACTMVLGLLPRGRVCVTPNAVLGFHAAWRFDDAGGHVTSASGTRTLMKTYPAPVRTWIAQHGGLTPNMKILHGRELAAIVPPCDDASGAAAITRARRVGSVRQVLRADPRRASVDAP